LVISLQINQNYEIYKNKNTKASVEYCNNILRKIFTQIIEEPLQSKKYSTARDLLNGWKKVFEQYRIQSRGSAKTLVSHDFLVSYLGESFVEFFTQFDESVKAKLEEQSHIEQQQKRKLDQCTAEKQKTELEMVKQRVQCERLQNLSESLYKDTQQRQEKIQELQLVVENMEKEKNTLQDTIKKLNSEEKLRKTDVEILQRLVQQFTIQSKEKEEERDTKGHEIEELRNKVQELEKALSEALQQKSSQKYEQKNLVTDEDNVSEDSTYEEVTKPKKSQRQKGLTTNNLTIKEIKQQMTAASLHHLLPTGKERKEVYVALYDEHMNNI